MNRKICPHCKTENPEIAVFCKKCGALFRGDAEIRNVAEEEYNRRNIIIFAVCVVLLIVAFIVFKSGSAPKQTNVTTLPSESVSETTTVQTTTAATTTAAPETTTTTAPTTTETTMLTLPTLPPSTTAKPTTTKAASAEEVQEICDEFNELIYDIKAYEYDLSVHKSDEFTIEITSFSLPVSTDAINRFMKNLIPKTDETHNFSDGVSKEDGTVDLASYIPPASATGASVSAENVKSATRNSDGTITIHFKPDSSSFADGSTVVPPHISTATDHVDFGNFALGPVAITKAEISYPATAVTAEVDSEGDLKKLIIHQPVEVSCTGGVGSLTADVGMKIDATITYEITY